MVRTITCSSRGHADGVGPRHLFPEEILQIRPTTSPPLQGVESDIEVALQIIESTVDVVCKRSHQGQRKRRSLL
jgi:hypothetical protein